MLTPALGPERRWPPLRRGRERGRPPTAEGQLYQLAERGERATRDEHARGRTGGGRGCSPLARLFEVERGDAGEGATHAGDHVDRANVRMLLSGLRPAIELWR